MRDLDDFDEPDFGQHHTQHSPLHPDYIAPTNTLAQEHAIWRAEQRAAEDEWMGQWARELRDDERRWGA